MRIAINGFGRIGRNFLRTIFANSDARKHLEVVAVNIGPASIDSVAHTFKYDSLMGMYSGDVALERGYLIVDSVRIQVIAQADATKLPWQQLAVDWVVDCSGKFTHRLDAQKHIDAGARAVLISAPAHDEDVTIIPGVNDELFNKSNHKIVSLGSCTTNALLPMLKVVNDEFTIEHALMTTVHAYTNSQALLDIEDKDLRRSRAAAINIIPTTTGAMKVAGKVIPELQGKLEGMALRVPVPKVSIIDLVFKTTKPLTVESINTAFLKAAQSSMKNIMKFTKEPLVSTDFNNDDHSVIIDSLLTTVTGTNLGKAFGWYDNEWGYSCRLRDFLVRDAQ